MDTGLLVVPKELFDDVPSVPSKHLLTKAEWLYNTFQCFQETDDGRRQHQHRQKTPKHENTAHIKPRTRIGQCELSKEHFVHKDILGLMNKLSKTNKEHIIHKLKASYKPDFATMYVDVIWDLMLRAPDYQDIYTDVLLNISCEACIVEAIEHKWNNFFNSNDWIPNEDVLSHTDEYDDFCIYMKWKKSTLAAITATSQLTKKRLLKVESSTKLRDALIKQCNASLFVSCFKTFDIHIEQLLTFVKTSQTVHVKLPEHWYEDLDALPPAIRFKLYDIKDMIHKKYERNK
jgi:hypothetical protein